MATKTDVAKVMTKAQLSAQEKIIRDGIQAFVDVGGALRAIREGKGYKLGGHATFDDYTTKVWQFSVRYGQRLMIASEAANNAQAQTGAMPRTEAAARELTPLMHNKKKLKRVGRLLKDAGTPLSTATAAQVKSVVDQIEGNTAVVLDNATGKQVEAETAEDVSDILDDAQLSDECPHCEIIPRSYKHTKAGWSCGNCRESVFVGVTQAAYIQCDQCNEYTQDTQQFCRKCGSALHEDE